MNEQLQQALTAILNKTMSGVDAGVNFLSAEIPDVIHQLLLWKMVYSLVIFIGGVILLTATVVFVYKQTRKVEAESNGSWRKYKETLCFDNDGDVHPGIIAVIIGGCFGAGFGIGGMTNLTWLQIWIAPKIYLIEYAASLAK